MNEKIAALVKALSEKSIDKNVIWGKTNSETEFKVTLDSGVTVTIDSFTNDNVRMVDIAIYNVKGERVSYYAVSRGENVSNYESILKLYSLARDTYYKVDETIDDILNEIQTKKVVGGDNTNTQVPEEDDLPF